MAFEWLQNRVRITEHRLATFTNWEQVVNLINGHEVLEVDGRTLEINFSEDFRNFIFLTSGGGRLGERDFCERYCPQIQTQVIAEA